MPDSRGTSGRRAGRYRRRGAGILLALSGVVAAVALWSWWANRRLPHQHGRSVRDWFQEWCRLEEGAADRTEIRILECRTALVRLGTNAVPYLLEEALQPGRDTALRTRLHTLFRELPPGLGGGRFVPPSKIGRRALSMLRTLRPRADLVLPRLGDALADPKTPGRYQALLVLGTIRDPSGSAVGALQAALTNTSDPLAAGIACQSLQWIGPSASNALPAVVEALSHGPPNPPLLRWLTGLGPAAEVAAPRLEPLLADTNPAVRLRAALALVRIQPGHPGALGILSDAVREDPGSLSSTAPPKPMRARPTPGRLLCQELARGGPGEDPALATLIEPLARAAVATYDPRKVLPPEIPALEHVAPGRARALYIEGLSGSNAVLAATRLLRLDRAHAGAIRLLLERSASPRPGGEEALNGLAEGSAAVPGVIERLTTRAGDPYDSDSGIAAHSLARLRYREALVAAGLPESEAD